MAKQQFYQPNKRPRRDSGMYPPDQSLPARRPRSEASEGADQALGDIDQTLAESEALNQSHRQSLATPDIAEAEQEPQSAPESSGAEQKESEAVQSASPSASQEGGGFYKGSDEKTKKKGRGRFSTRQKLLGGGAGGVIAGLVFWSFVTISGPLQLLNLSKLLSGLPFFKNNSTSDISVRRVVNTVTGQREKNNLGILAGGVAQKHREKLIDLGIEPVFERPDGKGRAKIQAFSIDPNTSQGKSMISTARAEGRSIPEPVNGRVRIDVRGVEGGRVARVLTDHGVKLSGKKGITGWMAKRRLNKLFGTNFTPHNIGKRGTESTNDRLKRRQTERAKDITEGTNSRASSRAISDSDETPVDSEVETETRDIGDRVDDIRTTDDPLEKRTKLQQLRTSPTIRWAAAGAAVTSVVCAVKSVGDGTDSFTMNNVIKPLIRLAIFTVASGSQFQSFQGIDFLEGRMATEPLYDEETGTSVMGAESIMALSGLEGGEPLDPATKSQISNAYSGQKPELFEAIDGIPFVGTACKVDSFIGNLPIIKQAGDLTNQLLGGLSSIATGKSLDDWMGQLVAVLAGGAVDVLGAGAQLGGLMAHGAVLAANGVGIVGGGGELSPAALAEWNEYAHEQTVAENQKKSLFDRVFDVKSPDSVAGMLFLRGAPYLSNTETLASSVVSSPAKVFGSGFANIASVFTPKAAAQTINGYAFGPEFAIPLGQLNNDRYENVYDNLDRLEDNDFAKLKEANSKWGKCFGNPVDDAGNIVDKEVESYKEIQSDDCKNSYGLQEFQDYQMYINDAVSIRTLACLEGLSEEIVTKLVLAAQT